MIRILFVTAILFSSAGAHARICDLFSPFPQDPFSGIQFRENHALDGPAQAWSSAGIIEFNPRELEKIPKHVRDFIMLHEAAHILLLHGRRVTAAGNTKEAMKAAELEADSWAACVWPARWRNAKRLAEDVYQEVRGHGTSERHPASRTRLQNIKRVIEEQLSR